MENTKEIKRYEILESYMEQLEKELAKVQRKCKKTNCKFEYKVVDTITKKVNNMYLNLKVIEVEGKAIINDYELIGIIEFTEKGNLVKSINGNEIPLKYRNTENYCEHCNSKRYRKELFIIKNIKTNEYKQVGKSCVKLYTKGIDAESFVRLYECYTVLSTLEQESNLDNIDREYCEKYNPLYSIDTVLKYAINIINKVGYISTSSVNEGYASVSTKELIVYALSSLKELNYISDKYFSVEFTEEEIDKDQTELINKIKEYYLNLSANNDFIYNVQTLINDKYIKVSNIGYISYLPMGYKKVLEKQAKENKDIIYDYYGKVGTRYKAIDINSIEVIATYENYYGITTIYKIILADNNVIIWKSSNNYDTDKLSTFKKIDFTVKEHSIYKDNKQTYVTRCKLY